MEEIKGEQAPNTEVNLDALSAAEGSYDPFIHGDGGGEGGTIDPGEEKIPGGSGIPDGLPNLDGNNPYLSINLSGFLKNSLARLMFLFVDKAPFCENTPLNLLSSPKRSSFFDKI